MKRLSAAEASETSELVHEMRNQLTIARANIEAFIDGKLIPTTERLESLVLSLQHLDAMLTTLKSRTSGDAAQRMSRFDICTLLNGSFRSFEALAAEKGISLSVDRCPVVAGECLQFWGDPVAVTQIVDNLLINAVRYTSRGGTISVQCSRRAGELEVDVSDTGAGITPDEAPKIFSPGFRGSAAGDDGGSGIGLAVVKRSVEAHGGTVEFRSTARGTTFVVRLPGVPELPAAAHAARCAHCSPEK